MLRKISLLFLLLGSLTACAGQTDCSDACMAWRANARGRLMMNRYWPTDPQNPTQYLSGAAVVEFTVMPDGKITTPEIVMSSGNTLLDSAALVTVIRSAPFLPPPLDEGQKYLKAVVPVSYTMTPEDQIRTEWRIRRFEAEHKEKAAARKKEAEAATPSGGAPQPAAQP